MEEDKKSQKAEAIIQADSLERIILVNEPMCELLGRKRQDLLGKPVNEILPANKEDCDHIDQVKPLREKGLSSQYEIRAKKASGNEFWMSINGSPVMDDKGNLLGTIAVCKDISERKLIEEKMLLQQRAIEFATDGVLLTNPNKKDNPIIYVNSAFEDMMGYTEEEVIGQKIDTLRGEGTCPDAIAAIDRCVENCEKFEGEILNYRKDGTQIWLYLTISPAFDEKGKLAHYIAVQKDITQKKELEDKMVNAIVEAQEVERNRIANDLHDGLGQTLTAISLYLNSLEDKVNSLDERTKQLFSKTTNLIEQAVNETRMISHNLTPVSLKDFGLRQALRELIRNIDHLDNHLDISLDCNFKETRFEHKVEMTLYRVLQEIINNTLKHAKAKSLFIDLCIVQNDIVLKTKDDGIGFNVHLKSSGLGLSNMKNRISSLNGSIKINSRKNRGSTIQILVPVNSNSYNNKEDND